MLPHGSRFCCMGQMFHAPIFWDGKTRETKHGCMCHIFGDGKTRKGLCCGDAKDFRDAVAGGISMSRPRSSWHVHGDPMAHFFYVSPRHSTAEFGPVRQPTCTMNADCAAGGPPDSRCLATPRQRKAVLGPFNQVTWTVNADCSAWGRPGSRFLIPPRGPMQNSPRSLSRSLD